MPQTGTHNATSIVSAVHTLALGIYIQEPGVVPIAFGCLAGIVLTPDLDMAETHKLSWNFKGLWYLYWRPYSRAIPHRHFISHFPILGTAIRILYLLWWAIPFVAFYGWQYELVRWWITGMWWGLVISDIYHYIMDISSTWIKRNL